MKFYYSNKIIHFLFAALLLSLGSCKRELRLNPGDFKLKSQKFEGNKNISIETLEQLLQPSEKPNYTILGLPFSPKMELYWIGKFFYTDQETKEDIVYYQNKLSNPYDSLSLKRIKRLTKIIARKELNYKTQSNLFMRYFGEAPAVLNEAKVIKISNNIKDFYQNNGYKEAKVTYSISYLANEKASITYQIVENKPYIISKYELMIEDKSIDSLVRNDFNQHIRIGQVFKESDFNDDANFDEIDRIDTLMKNNGYFDFEKTPAMIQVSATLDTTNLETLSYRPVFVKLILKNPENATNFTKYRLNKISLQTTDPYIFNNQIVIDSTVFKGINYYFTNRKYPVKLISHNILIEPNQVFNVKKIEETQRKIFQLNQFGNIELNYAKKDSNHIDIKLVTPALYKYTWSNELNGNFVNDVGGGGVTSTLSIRNLLGKLESIENTVRVSYEGQPAIDSKIYRGLEVGFNTSLNFPTLLLPLSDEKFKKYDYQRSQIKLGINYSDQRQFQRTNFNLGTNYQFKPSVFETFNFSFLDVNLTNTNKTAAFEAQLEDLFLKGSPLKLLFGRQFVSSINGNYSFNNSIEGKNVDSKFYKLFFESGGTTLGLFKNQKIGFIEGLGGKNLEFFRFLKGNFDYRRYLPISKKNTIAYRTNIGIAYPYGKNKLLPYEKNFFVGGTGSIRAWTPRSLGPGASQPIRTINDPDRLLAQPGDILLEGSVEYRHYLGRFYGDIYGATFLDFGNVWKLYQDPINKNIANFDIKRFYKEIALGTGYGFRYDLSYFVFRYDIGIKIYDPSQTDNGFVIREVFMKKANKTYPYKIFNLTNFGIGFPF